MPQKLNILICGKIRDPQAFAADLDVYRSWRDSGFVERIVFSGWISDLHDNPDMLLQLRRNGVEVVLAEEPMVRMIGHIFHQAKSLHYGLSQFSDDDLVLKTRTDKVWLNFDIGYTRDRLENAPAPGPISPFKQRIIIQTS